MYIYIYVYICKYVYIYIYIYIYENIQFRASHALLRMVTVYAVPAIESTYLRCATQLRPGKGNSNSHGARPVHQIISMMKWIRTSKLSIKKSLSLSQ